jgi:hypothetical protein
VILAPPDSRRFTFDGGLEVSFYETHFETIKTSPLQIPGDIRRPKMKQHRNNSGWEGTTVTVAEERFKLSSTMSITAGHSNMEAKDEELICLCKTCHDLIHESIRTP